MESNQKWWHQIKTKYAKKEHIKRSYVIQSDVVIPLLEVT